ncbi:cdk10 [Scenedesmus sp. PABB004]|nr:cdk10 [Scenedesmus sp. PABB004]
MGDHGASARSRRSDVSSSVPSSPAPGAGDGGGGPLPVLDPVQEYEKLHRIGEGTYGVVYKARHIPTGEIVALKKVRFDRSREGVPVTSVRELAILQAARHPSIVRLLRVVTGSRPDSVFLVFEYAAHDLGRLLDAHPRAFSEAEAKGLFRQLAAAVAYLHERWVLHRDLKLSNLLLNDDGELKLCDFGLARHFAPGGGRLTPRVVTLWYRAPELLLGGERYGAAIDAWALGCVLGELLRGEPLFPASSEAECIHMHCALLGTPTPRIWPGMRSLPHAGNVRWPEQPFNFLRRSFPELSDAGLSLLNGLLTYDAGQRLTAAAALRHPYLSERPYPRRPEDMSRFALTSSSVPTSAVAAGAKRGRDGGGGGAPSAKVAATQRAVDRRFGEAFGGGDARQPLFDRYDLRPAAPDADEDTGDGA